MFGDDFLPGAPPGDGSPALRGTSRSPDLGADGDTSVLAPVVTEGPIDR